MAAKSEPISWGILGTGKIARQFTAELLKIADAQVCGIASRSDENARKFKDDIGLIADAVVFDTYEALLTDSKIDIVYIATPTAAHAELAKLALSHGKAVLCEKPFCCNAAEATAVFELARQHKLFAMEAMWLRFNPLIQRTKYLLDAGEIGDVRTMHAELGYAKSPDAMGSADQGRGARLAFGCYGASLALYLFGEPGTSSLQFVRSDRGDEDTMGLSLSYPDKVVSVQTSEWATLSNDVKIFGRAGSLRINAPFIDTTSLEVINLRALGQRSLADKLRSRLGLRGGNPHADPSLHGSGFRGEAEEAMRCLRAGVLESELMPQSDTVLVHKLLQT